MHQKKLASALKAVQVKLDEEAPAEEAPAEEAPAEEAPAEEGSGSGSGEAGASPGGGSGEVETGSGSGDGSGSGSGSGSGFFQEAQSFMSEEEEAMMHMINMGVQDMEHLVGFGSGDGPG